MEISEAYQTLKTCIELDTDDLIDAHESVLANPEEYRIVVSNECDIVKSSIEIGQSMISLGEIIRQFYNATHREIDNEIIDLPGAEFCKDIGKIANDSIQHTIQINTMTEEYAAMQISCNETVDISYI